MKTRRLTHAERLEIVQRSLSEKREDLAEAYDVSMQTIWNTLARPDMQDFKQQCKVELAKHLAKPPAE